MIVYMNIKKACFLQIDITITVKSKGKKTERKARYEYKKTVKNETVRFLPTGLFWPAGGDGWYKYKIEKGYAPLEVTKYFGHSHRPLLDELMYARELWRAAADREPHYRDEYWPLNRATRLR